MSGEHARWVFDLQRFADEGERTEKATPRRRREARRRGQIVQSQEIASLAILGAGSALCLSLAPHVIDRLARFATELWGGQAAGEWSAAWLMSVAWRVAGLLALVLFPLVGALWVVSLAIGFAQTGFLFSAAGLSFRWERLNPIEGVKRIASWQGLVQLLKSLAKIGAAAAAAVLTLRGALPEFAQLARLSPLETALYTADLGGRLAWRLLAVLAVLAAADWAFQRWQFEKGLRMSKQEVKQELREEEGDPQLRARRRQMQREWSRLRMLADVPRASVVIVNPTHYAAALRYEEGETEAPVLLAKGRGPLAARIRRIAEEHGIPVMEDPPLARSLYRLVAVGQEVPPQLYRAVAAVLAVVWRLERRVPRPVERGARG